MATKKRPSASEPTRAKGVAPSRASAASMDKPLKQMSTCSSSKSAVATGTPGRASAASRGKKRGRGFSEDLQDDLDGFIVRKAKGRGAGRGQRRSADSTEDSDSDYVPEESEWQNIGVGAFEWEEPECVVLDGGPTAKGRPQRQCVLNDFFRTARSVCLEPRLARKPVVEESRKAARARLAALLRLHGLKERPVAGDGSCQFRALADQLYGAEKHHREVRRQVVDQLEAEAERYKSFVPGAGPTPFATYVAKMRREGTWGDHVTLQAAADCLGVEVHLLTDYLEDAYIKVSPVKRKSQRVLRLCFWAEVHYNSVE